MVRGRGARCGARAAREVRRARRRVRCVAVDQARLRRGMTRRGGARYPRLVGAAVRPAIPHRGVAARLIDGRRCAQPCLEVPRRAARSGRPRPAPFETAGSGVRRVLATVPNDPSPFSPPCRSPSSTSPRSACCSSSTARSAPSTGPTSPIASCRSSALSSTPTSSSRSATAAAASSTSPTTSSTATSCSRSTPTPCSTATRRVCGRSTRRSTAPG